MKTYLKNRFIAFKIQELIETVRHYENGYFPELKEHTGFSQEERLEMAKKALKEFDRETWQPTKQEKANYLRGIAIQAREEADAFRDSNVYVKWRRLRECIYCIKELKKMYPELEIYSNHWLSLAKPIKLNNI